MCGELCAFGIYVASSSVAASLVDSSVELLPGIVAGGSGAGFASSCGIGFIADSQFGYVIFDLFFFEKPPIFVKQK